MPKPIDKSNYSNKATGGFKPVAPKMRESGFIRLRTGIFDHAASGKMTPHDFAVYVTLHKWANWRTGICMTTSASIAANWGEWGSTVETATDTEDKDAKRKKRTVQSCLLRLRKRGYIKYADGDGTRGSYPVAIDKYEPSLGALVGWSLDAEATTDYNNPIYRYVSPTPLADAYGAEFAAQHMTPCAVHVRSAVQSVCSALYSPCAVDAQSMCGACAVHVPLLDVLEVTRRVLEELEGSKKSLDGSTSSTVGDSLREGAEETSLDWLDESKTTSFNIEDDDDELA